MSSVKRKKMANNIAKFYIKIAHIYAAIASTIDPEYSYTDSNGVEQTFNLQKISELTNLPPHAFSSFKLKTLDNPIALCKKRLDILMNKFDINSKGSVTLNPGEKFCDMNKKEDSSSKSLESESGIHSLKQLYYDVYNLSLIHI